MNLAYPSGIPNGPQYSEIVEDTAEGLAEIIGGDWTARSCMCTIQVIASGLTDDTAALRFTIDGSTDPTVSIGYLVGNGDIINLRTYQELVNFNCISAEAGIDITLNIQFFKDA